jgi:hypothetical protein
MTRRGQERGAKIRRRVWRVAVMQWGMAKTQNSQKQTKKQPLKTAAEKKAAKREKKQAR